MVGDQSTHLAQRRLSNGFARWLFDMKSTEHPETPHWVQRRVPNLRSASAFGAGSVARKELLRRGARRGGASAPAPAPALEPEHGAPNAKRWRASAGLARRSPSRSGASSSGTSSSSLGMHEAPPPPASAALFSLPTGRGAENAFVKAWAEGLGQAGLGAAAAPPKGARPRSARRAARLVGGRASVPCASKCRLDGAPWLGLSSSPLAASSPTQGPSPQSAAGPELPPQRAPVEEPGAAAEMAARVGAWLAESSSTSRGRGPGFRFSEVPTPAA